MNCTRNKNSDFVNNFTANNLAGSTFRINKHTCATARSLVKNNVETTIPLSFFVEKGRGIFIAPPQPSPQGRELFLPLRGRRSRSIGELEG
ncbi:MAG: hypothetical protein LBR55_05695, partial [Bacteroidales bacterium]|nr:hypothetical protein [Bacteroidales bacterium]